MNDSCAGISEVKTLTASQGLVAAARCAWSRPRLRLRAIAVLGLAVAKFDSADGFVVLEELSSRSSPRIVRLGAAPGSRIARSEWPSAPDRHQAHSIVSVSITISCRRFCAAVRVRVYELTRPVAILGPSLTKRIYRALFKMRRRKS